MFDGILKGTRGESGWFRFRVGLRAYGLGVRGWGSGLGVAVSSVGFKFFSLHSGCHVLEVRLCLDPFTSRPRWSCTP